MPYLLRDTTIPPRLYKRYKALKWNQDTFDQWVRQHDCIAAELNAASDNAYDKSVEKIRTKQNEHKALQARDTLIQFRQQSAAQAAATKAVKDRDRKAAEQADKLKSDQQQNQNRPPRGRDSKRGKTVHTQITATLLRTLSVESWRSTRYRPS